MEVSFIQKQLDMGEPIEHEHTKDHKLAMDIALQHLDEFPDYYTRLKKMEASARKEHKKFKDVIIDEEGILDWFKSKSKDKKPGWVNVVTGGTCASDEPGEGVPKCVSSEKRANMTKAERLSAARRKKTADPGQQKKSGAAKPTYVSTDSKEKMKEEMNLQEVKDKPGKGSGKKDACYSKVKSRYDVWPSAYASGALVKCRKVGAANWGTKSEETNPAQQAAIAISMKKRGIKPKPEMKEDCWDGYVAKGMKKKGKKMVPNCVPVNSESTDSLDYDWDTPVRERADRYCPKCEKLERRMECKYGPRYWDTFSLPAELIGSKKDYNITMPHPGNFPESVDHEYSMARSEISTIIGAAKRLRKKIGKGEGNIEAWVQSKITKAADYLDAAADYVDSGEMKKESVSIEDANGNHYAEFIDIIKPEPLKASKGIGSQLVSEEPGDGYIGPARLGIKNPLASNATRAAADKKRSAGQSKEGGLVGRLQQRADATDAAIKMLNQSYSPEGKSFNQFMSEASPAWQRKEGKNSEGGLNKKGIASYRKENPGSNLSLAVTTEPSKLKKGSKSANRRKSFCSRMSGMKKKLTSAKTANDPDSRINKSLRKWNC